MAFTIVAEIKNENSPTGVQQLPLLERFDSLKQSKMGIDQHIVDGGIYFNLSPTEVHFYPLTSVIRFIIKQG